MGLANNAYKYKLSVSKNSHLLYESLAIKFSATIPHMIQIIKRETGFERSETTRTGINVFWT